MNVDLVEYGQIWKLSSTAERRNQKLYCCVYIWISDRKGVSERIPWCWTPIYTLNKSNIFQWKVLRSTFVSSGRSISQPTPNRPKLRNMQYYITVPICSNDICIPISVINKSRIVKKKEYIICLLDLKWSYQLKCYFYDEKRYKHTQITAVRLIS